MYNAQNPKNVAYLLQLAEVKRMISYKITYAFDTRQATSARFVLVKLRKSIVLIMVALESTSIDLSFGSKTRARATRILK